MGQYYENCEQNMFRPHGSEQRDTAGTILLKTFADVPVDMSRVKYFTKLDKDCGFRHIQLVD